ncbi:FGGY-family carbohydrate kinase [Fodinicola feengrottensis]|uniref:FGGY-family carbohydrate kinase n=1 Tax=Fodinicola feengrottensis TaxID=435914 RepID=UPI0024418B35|nr:FGGY family carbohydrate kinase [Fodinicola feengrottensis]
MGDLWAGVDIGTQSARVVLLNETGQQVAAGFAALGTDHRMATRHEQDPDEWWDAACAASRQALDGIAPERVRALAICGTSGTVLVVDHAGRPTGPAVMYDDSRARDEAECVQQVGADLWDRLGYRIQASWGLPKVLWLARHGELTGARRIEHQADHLAARLVGHPVATDTGHALKTGADLTKLSWPTDVLDKLSLDPAVLPDLVVPGTPLGTVSQSAAQACGLAAGTPVLAGTTDSCAAQIGAGALRPGSWNSVLGTTLAIKGVSTELLRDPEGSVYSHLHPDGGWLPGGASSVGAGVLSRDFPAGDLDRLTAAAAAVEPAPGVTYPLVGHGERFPFRATAAEGFQLGVPDDEAVRFAAVLQAVAFTERLAYVALAEIGADVSGRLTATGGGSRNGYWNQLRADVMKRPVSLPAHVEAAAGMAILAAAPAGELTATAEAMVRIREVVEPRGRTGPAGSTTRTRGSSTSCAAATGCPPHWPRRLSGR